MAKKQQKLYFAKHHNGNTCVELLLSEAELKKASVRASNSKNAIHLSGQKRCGIIPSSDWKEIVYVEKDCQKCFVCKFITKIKNLF